MATKIIRKQAPNLSSSSRESMGLNCAALEKAVVERLTAHGMTVATAESCTGGLLAKRITDLPGASAVFRLGVVTYSNEEKERVLGIPRDLLALVGAVSPQVARLMATNVRQLNKSDLGIGITGIAGPDGGTPEKPVGLVYLAVAFERGCRVREIRAREPVPSRDAMRLLASSHALSMILKHLESLGSIKS